MAGGSLGSLVVSMAVDTAKFQGDLGRAAAIAERRMKNIKDTASRALGAITIAASAAGTALTVLLTKSLRDADDMLKLAKSVGTTVEQLSALRYAADLAGVSQEELGVAMKQLASRAVDAVNGVKASESAFRALGIQVRDSNGDIRSTDELIGDVAEAFSKAPDSITKTAVATDLFGKSGSKLIPLLNEGRAGIERLKEEAARYGLVIDTQAAAAAERFNDNLSRLKSIVTGFGNLLAAELATPLANFSDQLVEGAAGIDRLKSAAETGATIIKGLASTLILLSAATVQAGKNIGALAAAYAAFYTGEFARSAEIIRERFADGQREIAEALDLIKALFEEAGEDIAGTAPIVGAQIAAPLTNAVMSAEEASVALQAIIDDLRQRYTAGGTDLFEVSIGISDESNTAAINREMEKIRKQNDELADSVGRTVEKFKEGMDEMSEFARQAARNIQSHFADFLFDPFDKGINGMLKGFIDVLRRMIAEAAAARILDGLEGTMGGILGGLFGGGGGGGGNFFSKLFGGAPGGTPTVPRIGRGFASGGFMLPGEIGLVGERGPELAMAGPRGATIVPFDRGQKAGGQVVVNYSVNVDARHSTPDAAEQLIRGLPGILERHGEGVEAKIVEGLRRNRYRLG